MSTPPSWPPASTWPRPTGSLPTRSSARGDLVFIDIGAAWSGYFGETGRTVVCGRPSRRQQEVFTAVHSCLVAATLRLQAGKSNDDVARAVREAAGAHGLAGNFISLFIGHGLGMGANEPPYVGEDLPWGGDGAARGGHDLRRRAPHLGRWCGGGAGVRLEDTILVTAEDGKALARTGFDERLLLP